MPEVRISEVKMAEVEIPAVHPGAAWPFGHLGNARWAGAKIVKMGHQGELKKKKLGGGGGGGLLNKFKISEGKETYFRSIQE